MPLYDYEHDDIGRREAVSTSGPAFENVPTPVVTPGNTTYTTNTLNQYPTLTVGSTTRTLLYDLDGNLTNDGTFSYTYDAENRMIAATPLNPVTGSKKLEATYDYQGRRVQKKISTYTAGTWTLDTTKTFVYDGWNVIQETTTTDSGTATEAYVWGLDVSSSLQGAGGIGGLLLWKNNRGTFLYLYDANGNVGQLVNSSTDAIAARYDYDPFGKTLVADGPEAANNPYRFSTKYFDAEAGLYYYIFRYYSAKLGRWPTRDPIEEAGGVNLYVFANNAPSFAIDLFGLKAFLVSVKNETNMNIVLVGSEVFMWYIPRSPSSILSRISCCMKTSRPEDERKVDAIPFVLHIGQTAKKDNPLEDPDAVIRFSGTPFKVGDRTVIVRLIETELSKEFDFDVSPEGPGWQGIYNTTRGQYGDAPMTDFWLDGTILQRCGAALRELEGKKTMIEQEGTPQCASHNENVLNRIMQLKQWVEEARNVLITEYHMNR